MKKAKDLLRNSILGRMLRVPHRLKLPLAHELGRLKSTFIWIIRSREITNYTYDLEDLNKGHLASFIAVTTGISPEKVSEYISELENDVRLNAHIRESTRLSRFRHVSDSKPQYARRLGWYALVRALKPKVVVETGVDKGLGSCVLSAALMKNAEEGHEGRMYGTDINEEAGFLLKAPYDAFGKILYGDSVETLTGLNEKIDLFIGDSDHSPEYEMREYEAIEEKLSDKAVIVSDNAHMTNKLYEFALKTGRSFLFFQEKPKSHWYPGAGIGIAFKRE